MGVLVEGKQARETIADINKGMFKDKIKAGKTELTAEELKALEEERKRLEEEMKARRAEYEARAKEIINSMTGKEPSAIRSKLREAKIPEKLIKELMPTEAAGAAAAPGAEKKPEAGKAAEAPKKETKKE